MKAVILSAGKGSRLGMGIPKSILDINNKSILFRLFDSLFFNDVMDVTVVTGYKHSLIEDKAYCLAVNTLFNSLYDSTENILSLYTYLKYNEEDNEPLLIISGDLLIDGQLMFRIINHRGNCLVVKPKKECSEDSMKYSLVNGFIFISKNLLEYDGELMPIFKIDNVASLRDVVYTSISNRSFSSYVSSAIKKMYNRGIPFSFIPIEDRDIKEIDTIEDLEEVVNNW
jgi:choline kinase